jgi:hypothetical protein
MKNQKLKIKTPKNQKAKNQKPKNQKPKKGGGGVVRKEGGPKQNARYVRGFTFEY